MARTSRIWLGLVVVASGLVAAAPAHSFNAPIAPTNFTDTADGTCDADCSLREAIIKANTDAGPDIITLSNGTYSLTIPKTTDNAADGDLDISDDLTINGPGIISQTISGLTAGHDRVLELSDNVTATLNSVDITGGSSDDSGGGIRANANTVLNLNDTQVFGNQTNVGQPDSTGGGIRTFGTLNLIGSAVYSNNATGSGLGGGGSAGGIIFSGNGATQTVTNSTISDNVANAGGGGLFNGNGDTVHVLFSTISNNSASGGGAIDASNGSVSVKGSILADNIPDNCLGGDVFSSGFNVIDNNLGCNFSGELVADPLLGSLQLNDSRTKTRAIPAGSPAVDRAPSTDVDCTGTDQRGVPRPTGGGCDAGAFEISDYPDASIALPNKPGVGLTIFNKDATDQTVTKRVKRGHAVKITVDVKNAGDATDNYTFQGCASSRGFSVHYFNGPGNDITSQVVAGTWQTPFALTPDSGYGLGMTIKVGRHGPKSKRCLVTLTSVASGTVDAVAGKVVAR